MGKPEFPLKEISFQSGLSLASVDRVLHGRGASKMTRARVAAALQELRGQYAEARLASARLGIDVVIEAPARFSGEVRRAFEVELAALRPASVRLRFHLHETMEPEAWAALLGAIRRRGTDGLVVKLPNVDRVLGAIEANVAEGVPLVTLVTDLDVPNRLAYIGMDNQKAGQLAAHLVRTARVGGPVLLIVSSRRFSGELERAEAFRAAMGGDVSIVTLSEAHGRDKPTAALVERILEQTPGIAAVYSAGGGNRAVIEAFRAARLARPFFVAHDLDRENRTLLHAQDIDFVIHHDLRRDARACMQHILRHLRLLPPELEIGTSEIGLATPFNPG